MNCRTCNTPYPPCELAFKVTDTIEGKEITKGTCLNCLAEDKKNLTAEVGRLQDLLIKKNSELVTLLTAENRDVLEPSGYDRENIGVILSGNADWFSAHLYRLIAKSDAFNRLRLAKAYPKHVDLVNAFQRGPV